VAAIPKRFTRLTMEQYKIVLQRKAESVNRKGRTRYMDLVREWGVSQSSIGTIIKRGIKQYDYRIWKGEQ
jgi:hypothetical protein